MLKNTLRDGIRFIWVTTLFLLECIRRAFVRYCRAVVLICPLIPYFKKDGWNDLQLEKSKIELFSTFEQLCIRDLIHRRNDNKSCCIG